MAKRCLTRSAILAATALMVFAASGDVAEAKAKPPTAKKLVTKLVGAQFCTNVEAVDVQGTTFRCLRGVASSAKFYFEIHAFTTKAKMLRSLDERRRSDCSRVFGNNSSGSISYLVGPTWWTNAYSGGDAEAIAGEIGGTVKKYGCP